MGNNSSCFVVDFENKRIVLQLQNALCPLTRDITFAFHQMKLILQIEQCIVNIDKYQFLLFVQCF